METINIKNELNSWLVTYILDFIHSMEGENFDDFNKWAKSYPKEAAEMIVGAEFVADWADDERKEITREEAEKYAQKLIRRILDTWYL